MHRIKWTNIQEAKFSYRARCKFVRICVDKSASSDEKFDWLVYPTAGGDSVTGVADSMNDGIQAAEKAAVRMVVGEIEIDYSDLTNLIDLAITGLMETDIAGLDATRKTIERVYAEWKECGLTCFTTTERD